MTCWSLYLLENLPSPGNYSPYLIMRLKNPISSYDAEGLTGIEASIPF